MSHSSRITSRLVAAGCVFPEGAPTQAQYKCRGHEPNTWLVRRDKIGIRYHLVDNVRWLFGQGTESPSSGHEIILDLPAAELVRAPCLVGYTPRNDLWDLHLTDLDGYARLDQELCLPRVEFVHWDERKRRPGPAGHYCIIPSRGRRRGVIVEARYFGTEGVDPQVGVRVADQSHGVDWFRLSEVEVGKGIEHKQ